jgi:RNA polymerase-binding transcription factor
MGEMMDQSTISSIQERLLDELATVERGLSEYGASADSEEVELDIDEGFADSAAATTERSQILAHVEQLQEAHRELAAALARIADGSYGRCERCGRAIPTERLEARPTARLCVACKQAVGEQ